MILFDLIKQGFVKDFRSQGFYKGLAVKLLMGFLVLYFTVIFFMLGLFLGNILEEASDTLKPLELVNGAMIYIMFGGILIRYLMMQLNTLNIQVYQSLPIKRSSLVNYILLRPLFSFASYFSLVIILPFAFKSVLQYYSIGVVLQFIVSFIFVIWANTLIAVYLKRKFSSSIWTLFAIVLIVGGFVALEYFKIFSLFNISKNVFNFVTMKPLGLFIPLILAVLAYGINLLFFSNNYYPEKFNEKLKKKESVSAGHLSFLEKYGVIGELISLEIKLIFRHKRTKSLVILSAMFLLYGLIFYTNPVYADQPGWLFFGAVFTTGVLMLMYGQWIISWDSSHFDFILTNNIPVKTYLKANYYLLLAFDLITFILTTPYFFFGKQIIVLQIVAFVYNVGVNISLFLFFSSYNTKRIDLNARSSFNYQGTSYKSFLIVLPIMFLPMIIIAIASALGHLYIGLAGLGILGVFGFFFRNKLIDLSVNFFNKRKYKMAAGFREVE